MWSCVIFLLIYFLTNSISAAPSTIGIIASRIWTFFIYLIFRNCPCACWILQVRLLHNSRCLCNGLNYGLRKLKNMWPCSKKIVWLRLNVKWRNQRYNWCNLWIENQLAMLDLRLPLDDSILFSCLIKLLWKIYVTNYRDLLEGSCITWRRRKRPFAWAYEWFNSLIIKLK